MKAMHTTLNFSGIISLFFFFILTVSYGYAQIDLDNRSKLIKPETEISSDIYWHVKAYNSEAELLNVKAFDTDGTMYAVKGIQTSDNTSVLNVKAIVNGKQLPIKVIMKGEALYYPVKVIKDDGTLMDIKAMTDDGKILDVKGVSRSGNIVHLRAIDTEGKQYNLVALSPFGNVNVVEGIKMLDEDAEAVINGVTIFAHVKALRQL